MAQDEILIAIFGRADFERAKQTIAGFDQWTSYEDYRCEREGRLLSLAFAGQKAKFAPITIDGFLEWSRTTGGVANASRLESFADLAEFVPARRASRSGAVRNPSG